MLQRNAALEIRSVCFVLLVACQRQTMAMLVCRAQHTVTPGESQQQQPVAGLCQASLPDRKAQKRQSKRLGAQFGQLVNNELTVCCPFCVLNCSQPGTVSAIVAPNTYATCNSCQDGFYRSGDASLNNNVCKPIPAGGFVHLIAGFNYEVSDKTWRNAKRFQQAATML